MALFCSASFGSATSLLLAQSPTTWSPEPFIPPANVRPLNSANAVQQIHNGQLPSNRLRGDLLPDQNSTTEQSFAVRWKSNQAAPIRTQSNTTFTSRPQSNLTADPNVFEEEIAAPQRPEPRAQLVATNAPIRSTSKPHRSISDQTAIVTLVDDGTPRVSKKSRYAVTQQSAATQSRRAQVNNIEANNIQASTVQASTWSNRNDRSDVQTATYEGAPETFEAPGFSVPSLADSSNSQELISLSEETTPFQTPSTLVPPAPQSRSLLNPAPSNSTVPNPFLQPSGDSPSDLQIPPSSQSDRTNRSDREPPGALRNDQRKDSGQSPPKSKGAKRLAVNCDDVRSRAIAADISTIQLDVAPNFGVGPKDKGSPEDKRANFAKSAPSRPWYDLAGKPLAEGRLLDLENENIVIESATGEKLALSVRELSDADAVYVYESWGLPITCSLGDQTLAARLFEPTTVAWKASGLCHKPLYFEEIQLERSGHEWGPVVQPVLSTAHFFTNVAFLPYKMGIHPMSECQYALGHYRPGNCAPWSIEPLPLSLRGLAAQGAVVGTGAMVLP